MAQKEVAQAPYRSKVDLGQSGITERGLNDAAHYSTLYEVIMCRVFLGS